MSTRPRAITWALAAVLVTLAVILLSVGMAMGHARQALESAASGPAPQASTASETSDSSSVNVTVKVRAVRLLVLDTSGNIREIWSNTGSPDTDYRLIARYGRREGSVISPIPDSAREAYGELEESLDWTVRGLVYSVN